ncbi:hypothetical protein PBY51_015280 [Eleginops maclovinus]|uniref:Uncharacterized protein n=1 Tax=Eleginops maclovinus TaxID=56733 RepID=A0AAN8ABT5_ELEMC|nr:hypothetical protein PBY51_015280 [Eleginops maclovinus]
MPTVTCLDALNSDDEYAARNLKKLLGEKPYLYYPACNLSELGCSSSECGPSKSTPGPEGLQMWEPDSSGADFHSTKEGSSPLVNESCNLSGGVEDPSSSWILRTLHQVTFRSIYSCKNFNRRYLYAPPSDISGFVDEGFTLSTQAETMLAESEADEPPIVITQRHEAI